MISLQHPQEKMGQFLSLLLPFLLLVIGSLTLIKNIRNSKKHYPPSPSKLPIIGNLHQLGPLLHQSLQLLSKTHGPVMLLHLGFAPTLIISSAEAAKEVLKTHDLECCSRPALVRTRKLTRNYQDIAFAPYGDHWREMRKIAVLELFSLRKVQSFRFVREEEVGLLVKTLAESASRASPVNLSKTLFSLTASIIFRIAYGLNFHESKLIDKDRIEDLVFEAETIQGSFTASEFFPYFGWIIDLFTGQNKRLEKNFVELDTFLQHVIDDHLKPGRVSQDHQDIVDVLLNITKKQGPNDSFQLNIDSMKGVLVNIFLGGIDTSAITTIWAMSELVRNPRIMRKAQDEIRCCIGKKDMVTEDDVDQLHYLKMIIKETFRLHPAAPLLVPRETMAPIKIMGYDVDPKTRIQINAWAIGRDPAYWENAEEFIPERFQDSSIDYKGQHFELLPFGSGRRMCPAMAMGVATIELTLANLLYHFNWKLPDGMTEMDFDMEEAGTLTTVKKAPLELLPIQYH